MNKIIFRKHGGFYHVFDDDCYILYYLFDYKISNRKVGFPLASINKVISKLDELHISYEIIDESFKDYKNLNKYTKYYKLGLDKYNKDLKYINLYNKIETLNEEKLDKILDYIESIIDEK